jgi:2-oxoglutarate dehydrogenase E1 component
MASDFSPTANAHPEYIENLYITYRKDPNAIDPSWSDFFRGFDYAADNAKDGTNGASNGHATAVAPVGLGAIPQKEVNVMALIDGYRHRGHLLSTTNPLKPRRDRQPFLAIKDYGLTEEDLSKTIRCGRDFGLEKCDFTANCYPFERYLRRKHRF